MSGKAQDDDLVMSLVESALAQPVADREAYARNACGDDSDLFQEVWRYVEWDERMAHFLSEPYYPPVPAIEHLFEEGDLLADRFRVVREVARGGMGIVYEALDQKLERRIALKCAKAGHGKRLPPEVRNASEISHPNICKIFEIHTASTRHGEVDFFTMEFLEGETLTERLRRGKVPETEARTIAKQLCAGLAEAHRHHVIHGDLKSNNVILTKDEEGAERAVITDFGLAQKPRAADLPQGSVHSEPVGGTPDYLAPELYSGGKPSVASDIYALGVLLYELASGHRPFGKEATWEQRLTCKPPAVHSKWNRILARCLNPDPALRCRSADEVARAIDPPGTRKWLVGAAAAAVVLAFVVGIATYQGVKAPMETVRLAVLPFETDADTAPLSEGLLLETSDRLKHVKAGLSRRLSLIPIADALEHKVDQPAKARTILGATYALHGVLRKEAGRVRVLAFVTDTSSLVHLKEWPGEYSMDELRNLPVALAGMVTGTLKLPPLAAALNVNAAAYVDYSAGVALARREPEVDRALPALERAVAADPNSPLTHVALAGARWVRFTHTKETAWQEMALFSLRNAEHRNPDLAAVRVLSGLIHDYSGQYELAQADLLRAVELDPANGDAWRELGKVYENSNQPNQALAAYLKAINLQPDYFKNYLELGFFYYRRGEYEEAVRHRRKMVELAPDLPEAHYQLAQTYMNMGRYAEADTELNAAIGLHETANAVLGQAVVRMYQGRDREAIPYIERALKIGPVTPVFYLDLGTAKRRCNLPREAEKAYRKGLDLAEAAVAENPMDAYQRSLLAYLLARVHDSRRADFEAGQALRISDKARNDVRYMAVLTYEALGQQELTLAIIQDAPASLFGRLNRLPDLADLRANPRFKELLVSHHIQ